MKFVFDIYPDLDIPQDYLDKFTFMNIKIANPQQIMINEIVKYIKENNYFGEKYHKYKEKQIVSTKWWVNNFYPPTNNIYEKNLLHHNRPYSYFFLKRPIQQNYRAHGI